MNDVANKAILRMLDKHNWNKSKAAQELGIHRTTLWRKLRRINNSS
jgi:transcriptional regulator of acetoin/glycerol metabolism